MSQAACPIIAIDYTAALEQGGGIGRYTRELVRALGQIDDQSDYRLFTAGQHGDNLPDLPGSNFAWRPSRISAEWFARLWHRARLPLPVEWWAGPVDLYHATDFTLPPTRRQARTILTVHDLSFVRAPETAEAGLRAFLNRVVPRSINRADHVLADSKATRSDIIELYGVPADKVSVLYSGVDERFAPVTDRAVIDSMCIRNGIGEGPYILSVGTVQPRKNYVRLVEAFASLDRPDLKLVIAGGKGWLDDPLYQTIADLGLNERVHLIGFAADADLPALYSGAEVFVFPSLYEGFGLPPLEAMACGTPVVASNVSSVPEVVGDAGLPVDPASVEAIQGAIEQALDDQSLRASLRERGIKQAKLFTWRRAAEQLKSTYVILLESRYDSFVRT